MAFKFPFTNYHELNLTWILEQLKKLFEDSEENVETIEGYENRLSAVETELPVVEATANQAISVANAAATLAQTAKATADTANENALTASAQAGLARQEAATAEAEAQAATQAAQQAQATAQDFDGRITQAEADASEALQEAQSFENRVNAAINTANNAANTATIAQGVAVNANQNAATALDTAQTADGKADTNAANIGNLANLTTTAKNNLVAAINEAAQSGGGSGDNTNCAPIIINTASGAVASFTDGANNRKIRKIVGSIVLQQASGTPSPSNPLLISGHSEANIYNESSYDASAIPKLTINWEAQAGVIYGGSFTLNEDGSVDIVIEKACVELSLLTWTEITRTRYATEDLVSTLPPAPDNNTKIGCISEKYPEYTQNRLYGGSSDPATIGMSVSTLKQLCVRTAASYTTFGELPSGKFVYPLVTPQTYHLTNIGQIYTYLGVNNVWIDTGELTECNYPADTKLYIDEKVAELQALILEH